MTEVDLWGDPRASIREGVLRRLQFNFSQRIGKSVLLHDPKVYVEELPHLFEESLMRIVADLPEEPLETFTTHVEFSTPASWWQALKQEHLQFLTKWFPVKLTTHRKRVVVDVSAVYPKLPMAMPEARYHRFHYVERS